VLRSGQDLGETRVRSSVAYFTSSIFPFTAALPHAFEAVFA